MILKRYLHKEILQNFFAIFLVLVLIVFSLRFVRYLGDVAAGKMTAEIIYQILVLKLITSMTLIIPLCLYLSLFMALGRFQRDNELTSIASTGLGNRFYFSTILKLSAVFSLLLLLLTLLVMPWAEQNIDVLKQKANRESDITGITAGSFKEFSSGDRVLYAEGFDEKTSDMANVFLQVKERGKTGVLTSDSASIHTNEKNGERSVIFHDGKRYIGTPDQLDYSITKFQRYSVKMEQSGYNTTARPASRFSSKELLQIMRSSPENKMPQNELQWRLATPIFLMLLSAFAVIAVRSSKDIKNSFLFFFAILIFFIYNNLLNISHDMVKRDLFPAFPGLWWPHFLMLICIFLIVYFPNYSRRRKIKNLPVNSE